MEIYKSLSNKIDRSNDSDSLLYRIDFFLIIKKKTIIDGFAILILSILVLGTIILLLG